MTDTTKQRLIDSGMFTEGGTCEDHGSMLIYKDIDAVCGGSVRLTTTTRLRFNSAGELTWISTSVTERA